MAYQRLDESPITIGKRWQRSADEELQGTSANRQSHSAEQQASSGHEYAADNQSLETKNLESNTENKRPDSLYGLLCTRQR